MNLAKGLSLLLLVLTWECYGEEIHTTKVFVMTIGPSFFNWSDSIDPDYPDQFSYRPALLDFPDLPSWMHYRYSHRLSKGFVYGTPPPQQGDVQIEVVGVNKRDYEVRRRVVFMKVIEKEDPALFKVELKVDKLDVEDMLDSDLYDHLLGVFRKSLWPDSQHDLYMMFLLSAVEQGSRAPLRSTEGEGIMIHIGSRAMFSQRLLELQKEVNPLRSKGQVSCSNFKQTSVERFFKQHNLSLDWCAFQLTVVKTEEDFTPDDAPEAHEPLMQGWLPVSKEDLPCREFLIELIFSLLAPTFGLIVVTLMMTFVLFSQPDLKQELHTPHSQLVQYEAVQKASTNLRSLSMQRDSKDPSPRESEEETGLRPSPPPYSGEHQATGEEEFMDDEEEEPKTWYC